MVEALSRPDLYPERPDDVAVRETHISYVFLAGASAYKLKKDVVLPYVDYGTRERRRLMCFEEVRLNRRLAPSVYRGVLSVAEAGGELRLDRPDHPRALEHVVAMRRFQESDTLAARIARSEAVEAVVASVARRLAEFHAAVSPVQANDPLETVAAAAAETFSTLRELRFPDAAGERFSNAFLLARGAALRARAEAGLVRDGHGDLRAEHVLLEGGDVEIVDCVEFDPELRAVDVGADLSFLAMDLELLGNRELARLLVAAYAEAGGDPGDGALVAFHGAHRARVRAKVAMVGARRSEAGDLLALARRLSWRSRGPLPLIVCGLSGSGKSTLAREMAAVSGASAISSDRVRKGLARVEPAEHAPPEAYSDELSRQTYEALGRLASAAVTRDGVAMVDATFRRRADRRAFVEELGRHGEDALFVECTAPPAVLLERARRRAETGATESDATAEVVRRQRFEPIDEIGGDRRLLLETDRPVAALADVVEAWLDTRLR